MRNKYSKKWAAWLVLVTLFLNILAPMPLWAAEQAEGTVPEAQAALNQAAEWMAKQHGDFTLRAGYPAPDVDNSAFLLARMNGLSAAASRNYYQAATEYVASVANEGNFYVTAQAKMIMAVNALGYAPDAMGQIDLLGQFLAYDFNQGTNTQLPSLSPTQNT